MPGIKEGIEQATQFWRSRTGAQKALFVGGAAGTALLLALMVRMMAAPDYKPLYTGLEAADAQILTAELDKEGIPHQASVDGKTISVPADKLDAARLQAASHGSPHSGRMGFELFDKASWGQTEFDEKVTYQRALEGELERTIQALGDVESARVHLVMPTDSVFLDRERAAKASVLLKLRRGTLSHESVVAISRLIAGAVDELKPEDVSIIDADSERSYSLGQNGDSVSEGLEAELKQRLLATLEPVVGTDRIRASVNVDYDRATTDERDEKYDPAVSALLNQQKSEDEASDGVASAGIPGTGSNTPSKQAKSSSVSGSNGTQRSVTESSVYGVNKSEIHRVVPAGRVARITTAILVDDAPVTKVVNGKPIVTRMKRSPEELGKIQQLAEATIGFDARRGDSINVQNLSFEDSANAVELPRADWKESLRKSANDYAEITRPISLLILFLLAYLFMVRPVQKRVLAPGVAMGPQHAELESAPTGNLLESVPHDQDGRRAAQLKQQALELVKQQPANSARAVQAWLREDLS